MPRDGGCRELGASDEPQERSEAERRGGADEVQAFDGALEVQRELWGTLDPTDATGERAVEKGKHAQVGVVTRACDDVIDDEILLALRVPVAQTQGEPARAWSGGDDVDIRHAAHLPLEAGSNPPRAPRAVELARELDALGVREVVKTARHVLEEEAHAARPEDGHRVEDPMTQTAFRG